MPRPTRRTSRSSTAARKGSTGPADAWLTAAERKILDGTVGRSLAEAPAKQLQATMARARRLRDKWRDLFNRQMQAAKRTPQRAERADSRSLDKADLFAAAVRRVEARLSDLAGGAATPAKSTRSRKATARPATAKTARRAGQRKQPRRVR